MPSAAPTFVGVTRYSVLMPKAGAWKLSREAEDVNAYRDALWSPERMAPRASIFLEMVVPILQSMSESHDYRHIVLYSETMPDPWLTQLKDAARDNPVLLLVDYAVGPTVDTIVGQLARQGSRGSRPVVQFRLDDDDLLAVDYLDRIAAFATEADAGRAISLAAGYAGLFRDGAVVGDVRRVRRVFGSQGLAYVGWYDRANDRLDLTAGGRHYEVDRKMPTLVDSRTPAYFQMRHAGQDTLIDAVEAERVITAELATRPTEEDFGKVTRAFPTLAGRQSG